MNTAAPDGAPPRRISKKNQTKRVHTSCPAVPRRGPEAGVLIKRRFHGLDVELIYAVFPTSKKIEFSQVTTAFLKRHQASPNMSAVKSMRPK